jgi:hypothetical protein
MDILNIQFFTHVNIEILATMLEWNMDYLKPRRAP